MWGTSLADLRLTGIAVIFLVLPAVLAGITGAVLKRSTKQTVLAAVGSATVAGGSFLLFVVIFFLTVPDDFFQ